MTVDVVGPLLFGISMFGAGLLCGALVARTRQLNREGRALDAQADAATRARAIEDALRPLREDLRALGQRAAAANRTDEYVGGTGLR